MGNFSFLNVHRLLVHSSMVASLSLRENFPRVGSLSFRHHLPWVRSLAFGQDLPWSRSLLFLLLVHVQDLPWVGPFPHALGRVATLRAFPRVLAETDAEVPRLGERLSGPSSAVKTPGKVVVAVTGEWHDGQSLPLCHFRQSTVCK